MVILDGMPCELGYTRHVLTSKTNLDQTIYRGRCQPTSTHIFIIFFVEDACSSRVKGMSTWFNDHVGAFDRVRPRLGHHPRYPSVLTHITTTEHNNQGGRRLGRAHGDWQTCHPREPDAD